MPLRPLTARQRCYVDEYVADQELNQERAAIKAGYSAHWARSRASVLMRDPRVAAAIGEAMRLRSERTGITADVILQELKRLALVDIGQAFDAHGQLKPLHEMPEDVRRAIASVETESVGPKRSDSMQAMARDRLGLLDDGAELAGVRLTKIKFWDKVRGLELLGKHLKLFTDKVEVAGKLQVADGTRDELLAKIARLAVT